MIELFHLQHLLAFAKYGTLSKAAEEMHISQPSLSRSMQMLESELQVTLFERQKNRISLNDNGKLAVDYAQRVLDQLNDMTSHIRSFDRASHTISVGSCAPAPLWGLLPRLSQRYSDMVVSSEIVSDDSLLPRLRQGDFQFIVLPYAVSDDDCLCQHYIDEQLYLSIPPTHRLANRKEVAFSDFDGENMILFSDLGVWDHVHLKMMPNSRFLIQNERFAFDELIHSSVLPCFCTDLSMIYMEPHDDRIKIPITNPEAKISFYLVCLKKNYELLKIF